MAKGDPSVQPGFGFASPFPGTGARGGPNVQAPWASMVSGMGGGGGMGQGYGMLAVLRRRLMGMAPASSGGPPPGGPQIGSAAPFPGTGPGGGPPPITPRAGRGQPNIQAPGPSPPRQPSQWQQDLNDVGFSPEELVWLRGKRDFPGAERLGEVAGAQRQLRAGTYGPQPLGGAGGGFAEGYPGDALRRLLQARLGGSGF